jgi:hypothetical protein
MSILNGPTNQTLDFNLVAATPGIGKTMEPKLCEFCGRQFFREVPERTEEGRKYCGRCNCQR